MLYPYHYVGKGVFLEALLKDGVAIIRKQEARLNSRTLLRTEFTSEEWQQACFEMARLHKCAKGDKPQTLGPRSAQGNEPDEFPIVEEPMAQACSVIEKLPIEESKTTNKRSKK